MAAYVIVEVSISDEEVYEKYKPLAAASIAAHGGSYRSSGRSHRDTGRAPRRRSNSGP